MELSMMCVCGIIHWYMSTTSSSLSPLSLSIIMVQADASLVVPTITWDYLSRDVPLYIWDHSTYLTVWYVGGFVWEAQNCNNNHSKAITSFLNHINITG